MTDKKKKSEELKDKDLDEVKGGILSSGHGTRNIKKPDPKGMERVFDDE